MMKMITTTSMRIHEQHRLDNRKKSKGESSTKATAQRTRAHSVEENARPLLAQQLHRAAPAVAVALGLQPLHSCLDNIDRLRDKDAHNARRRAGEKSNQHLMRRRCGSSATANGRAVGCSAEKIEYCSVNGKANSLIQNFLENCRKPASKNGRWLILLLLLFLFWLIIVIIVTSERIVVAVIVDPR